MLELSLPKKIKVKMEKNIESVAKYASYFPLWQISPKFTQSHREIEMGRKRFLNSIVSLPKMQKYKKITRDDIILSLRNGIRLKKLNRINEKFNKAFRRRGSVFESPLPNRFSLSSEK